MVEDEALLEHIISPTILLVVIPLRGLENAEEQAVCQFVIVDGWFSDSSRVISILAIVVILEIRATFLLRLLENDKDLVQSQRLR